MITIRPGSHAYRLILLLSVAGEFPTGSLGILGNVRVIKALVHKMESIQSFRSDRDGDVYTVKLLTISGKRGSRTIRLYKSALPLLEEIHPDALRYYLNSFWGHRFPGNSTHIWRNHRVSEALAMSMMAGIEIRAYAMPKMQMAAIRHTVPDYPGFFIARDFKKLDTDEFNKTMFTRIVGAIFYPGGVYAVYNTREATMKWSGMGEFKASRHLLDLSRANAGIHEVNSALLIGGEPSIALQTLIESDKTRLAELRFDKTYQYVHFLPMDQNGVRLMRILTLPDWNQKMKSALFSDEMRPRGYGSMEYDAYWEGKYIYSHLDSDIARLIRFRQALETQTEKFEVLCFPWQTGFLTEYLGQRVILKQLEMGALESALGIEPYAALKGGVKEA